MEFSRTIERVSHPHHHQHQPKTHKKIEFFELDDGFFVETLPPVNVLIIVLAFRKALEYLI